MFKRLIGWLSTGLICLSLSGCALFMKQAEEPQNPQCYWMENATGKYEWVATLVALGQNYTYEQCYAADSCDGGLGQSGGGCYKWANRADGQRFSWPQQK